MKILNLTQHPASAEQIAAGVVEPADKKAVQVLLTFTSCPTRLEIEVRANDLGRIARESHCEAVMIGGAGYLMGPLESRLLADDIEPLHSFSERKATETVQPDGSIKKVMEFRHVGFVPGK